ALKLLTILEGPALQWYKTMRLKTKSQDWDFWRAALCKKWGNTNWKRKKQEAFNKDRFIPGELEAASWVTTQYGRLKAFQPELDQETINFKLLGLMDKEVEYAAKTAMRTLDADLTTMINILEDISNKTNLGRRRNNQPNTLDKDWNNPNMSGDKDKVKNTPSDIICYTCRQTGHTSRSCPKRINNIGEDTNLSDKLGSEYNKEGPVIGQESCPASTRGDVLPSSG
ncbi:hypothetical protein PTTG_29563, partial [Puccinia triticina 1-1 BBBD Race 1]